MTKLLTSFVVAFLFSSGAFAQGTAEEAYLDELLSARHLQKYMTKDVGAGLSELQSNPAPYLTLIDNELVFPGDGALDTYFDLRERYGRLIGLLETIGTEEARQILERAYSEVVDDMEILNARYQTALADGIAEDERLAISRDADAAYSIFVDILYVLKRLGDDRVLVDALARYEGFNTVTRLAVSAYNEEVGTGAIIERVSSAIGGWNMIGMPVEPLNNEYTSVYSDIELVGTPFIWTSTGYEEATNLAMGNAYWINAAAEGDQSIVGINTTSVTIPGLSAGWNNVAGPSCTYAVNQMISDNPAIDGSIIYGWQPENGYVRLEDGDDISPGSAFWIFLDSAATLEFQCIPFGIAVNEAGPGGHTFKPVDEGFRRITVADGLNRSRSLYFGNQVPETIQASFALPPIPPPGSFDVRFVDDVTLVGEGDTSMEIQLSTDQYPVTVSLGEQEGGRVIVEEVVAGQVTASQVLESNGLIEITNPAVSVLRIRTE